MDINDHLMNHILNNNNNNKESEKKGNNSVINTLIFNTGKIYSFEIKNIYHQIECLSLRDSFIKNISFLLNFPNIYYLDLFGNPIENYKPLVKIGTFGFLCISPPLNYFEKIILSLKYLNVVILQAEIKDKGIYNNFLMRNPNILVFNNTIIDFGKKIRTFYTMINFRYYIQNFLIDKDDYQECNNVNKNTPRKSINIDALYNRDIFLEKRLKTKKKKVTNKKCLEIIKFYEEYNKNLFEIFKNNKSNFNQNVLCVEEKKKFLMIYNTFNYIGHFFSKRNNYFILCPKKIKTIIDLKENPLLDYPNINIEMFSYLNFLQYKEFILSIIILYLFSILSKEITYYLILLIFKKTDYYRASNKNKNIIESDLKLLLEIDKSFLFAFYFKIYDILFEVPAKNIDLNKLYEVQDRLKMILIADKINEILSNQESFIEKYKLNTDISQKNKIITKDFIRFLFDIKMFHKIFNIIQFVNDFIIYNKLFSKLGHEFPEDMQFFTEVQGLILINFDKSNEIKESMADKNYNKIQITNLLNNKFYFKNQNYQRTNMNNSIVYFNYKHKIFYPNKKKMELVENLKPCNEIRKEKEVLMKQNYINKVLKSFFQVINKSSNLNKEYNDNLKIDIDLIGNNRYQRNNSNQNEYINNPKNNIFKTYTFYNIKSKFNEDDNYKKFGKTISGTHKFKVFSSPIKKYNLKKINIYNGINNKKLLFNNDLLSNHFNFFEKNNSKDNKREIKCLNIREIVNKNRPNNLLFSYDKDKNKNKKEIKQFTFTINKKSKKHPYSLRIIKKGKIINNSVNNYNKILNYKKKNLKELNSISYNPFNLIGKNI